MVRHLNNDEVIDLRHNNKVYIVFQGCGGPLKDWINSVTGLFKDANIFDDNTEFDNVYMCNNNDLIFEVPKNSDIGKLAIQRLMWRRVFGAMWLDDFIDNGFLGYSTAYEHIEV